MTRLPKSNFSQGRLELGPQRVELAFLEQFLTRLIRHVNNVTSKILLGVNKGLLDIQSTIGHGLKDVIEKPKPIRSFDMHQRAVGTIVVKKDFRNHVAGRSQVFVSRTSPDGCEARRLAQRDFKQKSHLLHL